MKLTPLMGIALAGAVVVCCIVWTFLPALEAAQRKVDAGASLHLERARRLLHRYNPTLTRQALLLNQLHGGQARPADARDLSQEVLDEYQRRHAAMWTAFTPQDWRLDPPRSARANYGNLAVQVRKGFHSGQELLARNEDALDDALSEVERALSVASGDVSATTHAEAVSLQATILHYQGLALSMRASAKRREAEPLRRRLVTLARKVSGLEPMLDLVEESGIAEEIRRVEERLAQEEAVLREQRSALDALDQEIRDLEQRLATAERQRAEAAEAMHRLQVAGADFADPDGVKRFRARFLEHDRHFREADREALAVAVGSYPQAKIDASGDYLSGRYLQEGTAKDLTVMRGLLYRRGERNVIADSLERTQEAVSHLQTDIARLIDLRTSYVAAEANAKAGVDSARAAAADLFSEQNRVDSEALLLEEAALGLLDRSARAARQAANYAGDWVSRAREYTQGLSPEAAGRSALRQREDDGWMGGHILAKAADALLAKAWIHYDRYHTYTQNEKTLGELPELLRLPEMDVQAQRDKAAEAQNAGLDDVQQAIERLQRAHRDADGHWTFVAQEAGTTYLLALLGFKEYEGETIEGYRAALQGREDAGYTRRIAARLRNLESR